MKRAIGAIVCLLAACPITSAQVTLNREDAINFPSRHAWNLFLTVNHPSKDPKLGRGVPDLTKPIGTPGTTVVWETWRLSASEVFLARGAEPPPWDDMTLPGSPVSGKVPEPPKAALLKQLQSGKPLPAVGATGAFFDPDGGVFTGQGGFGESRMNKVTYEFVRAQKLYSIEGQSAFATDFIAGRKPALSFPVEAMEVKGAWRELTPEEIQNGADRRYYLAEFNGRKFGLTSLHIITKDLPNWFWCTFHHVDNPATGAETPDTFGRPAVLDGTVWQNYKLGGTQTDFVTSIGSKTFLSDAFIEKGFERSSCITCHSQAKRNPADPLANPFNSPFDAGAPDENLFLKNNKPFVAQMDFLFSLATRAHSVAE
jgi:hypothetical protein